MIHPQERNDFGQGQRVEEILREVEPHFTLEQAAFYCGLKYHTMRRELLKRGGFQDAGMGEKNFRFSIPKSLCDQIKADRLQKPRARKGGR